MEVELKLSATAADLARLARFAPLRAMARGAPTTRLVHSVYYDTGALALRAAGFALRLRRSGGGWVQTLKGGGRVEAGLHQREETETPVASQLLDLPALRRAGLPPPVLRALQPVFVTRFRRTIRQLEPRPGVRVEMCVDRGDIRAGGRTCPISEVELELLDGPPQCLAEIALALLPAAPLRLANASKAERGYALAEGTTRGPVRAAPVALDDGLDVTAAFRRICFSCVAQLQANEEAEAPAQWPETLHQARVGLRRLRSALSLFAPAIPRASLAAPVAELRWLGSVLGPARDWDVFVEETMAGLLQALPGHPSTPALLAACDDARSAWRTQAQAALRSRRYTAALLHLQHALLAEPWRTLDDPAAAALRAMPLEQFAHRVLRRRHRRVLRCGEELDGADTEALHRLRIEVKKLRYALDFFLPLLGRRPYEGLSASLARLQELLGGLNDLATARALLGTLPPQGLGEAIALVEGFGAARAHTRLALLPQAWKQFLGCRPRFRRAEPIPCS